MVKKNAAKSVTVKTEQGLGKNYSEIFRILLEFKKG